MPKHPNDIVILHDPQTAGLVDPVRETGAIVSGDVTSASISPLTPREKPGIFCGPTCSGPMPTCSRAPGSRGRTSRATGSL